MSKAEEIRKRWKDGEIQKEIAEALEVSEPYVSKILAPLKNGDEKHTLKNGRGKQNLLTTLSPEIKRIFERIHRNLDKTWGYDNKMGREKKRPKYRNLWEDWNFFKDWFESLT